MSARFYGYIHSVFGSLMYVSPNNAISSQEQLAPSDFDSVIAAPAVNNMSRFIFRLKPGKELTEPYATWLKGGTTSASKSIDRDSEDQASNPTFTGTLSDTKRTSHPMPESTRPVLTKSAFEANMAAALARDDSNDANDFPLAESLSLSPKK